MTWHGEKRERECICCFMNSYGTRKRKQRCTKQQSSERVVAPSDGIHCILSKIQSAFHSKHMAIVNFIREFLAHMLYPLRFSFVSLSCRLLFIFYPRCCTFSLQLFRIRTVIFDTVDTWIFRLRVACTDRIDYLRFSVFVPGATENKQNCAVWNKMLWNSLVELWLPVC